MQCFLADMAQYLGLGMESFAIADRQLTASSQAGDLYAVAHARLNHWIEGGAWKPKVFDQNQYLQVDVGRLVVLTGVATQGHPDGNYRITAFEMRLATLPNEVFQPYSVQDNKKVSESFSWVIIISDSSFSRWEGIF